MLESLKKRRKQLLWARWTCFAMSIACCTVPVLVVAKMAFPSIAKNCNWVGISGFGLCLAAIIFVIVAKGAVKEIVEKIPFTVGVLVSEGTVLCILIGLKSIIEDAILIFEVAAIGAAVGAVFNLASYFINIELTTVKEKILRIEIKGE